LSKNLNLQTSEIENIMFKKITFIAALFVSCSCWAADTFNAATGQLTIQSVSASGTIYNNVVITVGSVIDVRGGNPTGNIDIYDPITNQLSIPSVVANGTTYTNVVISVGQIVSVGAGSSNGGPVVGGSTTDTVSTNSSSVVVTTFIAIN